MPSDRLQVINDALSETGNNTVSVEFDGSDEWNVASRAYERALPVLVEAFPHNWATTTETLSEAESNPSQAFADGNAFRIPTNALNVQTVFAAGGRALTGGDYEIVNRCICTFEESVSALYVRDPGPSQRPPMFNEALTKRVEAGILRGLNEDFDEARRREGEAIAMAQLSASKSAQQAPGRVFLRSTMLERRRGGSTRTQRGETLSDNE